MVMSVLRRPFGWYARLGLVWKFAGALVLGVVAGSILTPGQASHLQPFGDLFLNLLQMVIIPVVLFTIVTGLATSSTSMLGRVGAKIGTYYLATTAVAVTFGILLALLTGTGSGISLPSGAGKPEDPPALSQVLLDIVPANPVQAMAEGNVLAVVFVAVIIGICVSRLAGSHDDDLRRLGTGAQSFFDAAATITTMVVRGVLEYGPIGVFALVTTALAELGMDSLVELGSLVAVVYGGIVVQLCLYAVLLLLFRAPLRRFVSAARLPLLTGYVTRSSTGTLPVTIRASEQMGVPRSISSFTLPIGATVNMDGTALYIGASVVFTANAIGTDLSVGDLAGVVVVATLASIGTVAVPGAGLIMLGVALQQAGLPFAAIALIAGVDAFLDMGRTLCNIAGDLTGTRIVAGTEPEGIAEPAEATDAEESAQPVIAGDRTEVDLEREQVP